MTIVHFDVNIKPMLNSAIISICCPNTFTELQIKSDIETNVRPGKNNVDIISHTMFTVIKVIIFMIRKFY